MKLLLVATLLITAMVSCAQKTTVVEADKFAKGLTKENIQILDVRTINEYNKGHIKNALQANWNDNDEFVKRTAHLDKEKPLYIYCQAGGRSAAANTYFVQNGFKQVVELKGGMIAWKQANMEVEGASGETQMTMADYEKLIADTSKTYIVDFGASWCPPCVKQKPILDELKKERGNQFELINIDGGVHIDLKTAMAVESFPTLIVYKHGKILMRFEGLTPKEFLVKELEKQ